MLYTNVTGKQDEVFLRLTVHPNEMVIRNVDVYEELLDTEVHVVRTLCLTQCRSHFIPEFQAVRTSTMFYYYGTPSALMNVTPM